MRVACVLVFILSLAHAEDEDFTKQGDERFAALKLSWCDRLVKLATWDDKTGLHDEARELCDRALLLLPDHAAAAALLEKQKGKTDDVSYPDHKAQKQRIKDVEEHCKRIDPIRTDWRKEVLATATWCESKHLDGPRNASLRLAIRLLGADEFLAKCLAWPKVDGFGWVDPRQRDLLEPMSTYVYSADDAARAKAKETISAAADLDLVELQRTATLLNGYADLPGKGAEEKEEVDLDGEKTDLWTRVPIRYKRAERWPAIILLHPKEAKANNWVRIFKQCQHVYDRNIVVAPTLVTPEDNLSWRTDKAVRQVAACYRWLLERYNVDTDRVFIDGFGIGAAAFLHGQYTPDRYAGILLRSRIYQMGSKPSEVGIANLMHLPTLFYLGTNVDKEREAEAKAVMDVMHEECCPIAYRIMIGKGEDPFTEASFDMLDWFEQQQRDMFPRRVTLTCQQDTPIPMTRAYWLEANDCSYKGRLDAEVKGNTIDVKADYVKEYTVWLSDNLVDLDQPVKIVTNGETSLEEKVERDRWVLLDHVRETRDRMRTFVAKVKVKVPWKKRDQKEDK